MPLILKALRNPAVRQGELTEGKKEKVGRGDRREERKEEWGWRKLASGERGGGRRR